jgi:hypothetical protein
MAGLETPRLGRAPAGGDHTGTARWRVFGHVPGTCPGTCPKTRAPPTPSPCKAFRKIALQPAPRARFRRLDMEAESIAWAASFLLPIWGGQNPLNIRGVPG